MVLVDWPQNGFKQLTPTNADELPPLSKCQLDGYFTLRMGLDRRAVGDSQALAKGKLLVESKRVEACSFLLVEKQVYFSGICRAAMKKGVSFFVK